MSSQRIHGLQKVLYFFLTSGSYLAHSFVVTSTRCYRQPRLSASSPPNKNPVEGGGGGGRNQLEKEKNDEEEEDDDIQTILRVSLHQSCNIMEAAPYTLPPALQKLFEYCGTAVSEGPSTIPQAGYGLFANEDISAGTIVSFYPIHAVGVNLPNGGSQIVSIQDYDISRDTSSSYAVTLLGGRKLLGETLPGNVFVDMDPRLTTPLAWKAYRINDGAILERNSEEGVLAYYERSLQQQNTGILPFGPAPLNVAVTTCDVQRGDELFVTYSYMYWLDLLLQHQDDWTPQTGPILEQEQAIAEDLMSMSDYMERAYFIESKEIKKLFYQL